MTKATRQQTDDLLNRMTALSGNGFARAISLAVGMLNSSRELATGKSKGNLSPEFCKKLAAGARERAARLCGQIAEEAIKCHRPKEIEKLAKAIENEGKGRRPKWWAETVGITAHTFAEKYGQWPTREELEYAIESRYGKKPADSTLSKALEELEISHLIEQRKRGPK